MNNSPQSCYLAFKERQVNPNDIILLPAIPFPGSILEMDVNNDIAIREDDNRFLVQTISYIANESYVILHIVPVTAKSPTGNL